MRRTRLLHYPQIISFGAPTHGQKISRNTEVWSRSTKSNRSSSSSKLFRRSKGSSSPNCRALAARKMRCPICTSLRHSFLLSKSKLLSALSCFPLLSSLLVHSLNYSTFCRQHTRVGSTVCDLNPVFQGAAVDNRGHV